MQGIVNPSAKKKQYVFLQNMEFPDANGVVSTAHLKNSN